jgi:starch synthase
LDKTARMFISRAGVFSNRAVYGVPKAKLRTTPDLELLHLARARIGGDIQPILHARNIAFQRRIPDRELIESDAIVGFDTSSSVLVKRARCLQRPFFLDQTIAHPNAKRPVYARVAEQYPDWRDDLPLKEATLTAEEESEHNAANVIVAASSFTKQTLVEHGVDPAKIQVNAYGVDLDRFRADGERKADRPFRFIFVGLISARKGIPLLLEAWRALNAPDAELIIAGPATPAAARKQLEASGVKLVGKQSNTAVAELMADSDAFVFPSYFEGFGLVLLEALACGLPVLTTTATAGRDIISDDKNGWVIEPGDLDALVARMQWCCDNRDAVRAMRHAARSTADRYSWDNYGDRWKLILDETCAGEM